MKQKHERPGRGKDGNLREYVLEMPRCSRCGEAENMDMRMFKNGHPKFTHWGICKNTGEPLMVTVKP